MNKSDPISQLTFFSTQSRSQSTAPWYTNPQTESFCAFLQVPNLINPLPQQQQQQQPPQVHPSFNLPPPGSGLRLGNLLPAEGSPLPSGPNPQPPQPSFQPPTAPAKDREAEEIARIKESAERRRKEREELKEKRKLEQETTKE